MTVFIDDEEGYANWLEAHPTGYVLNTKRALTDTHPTLHLGRCQHAGTFSTPPRKMTRDNIKICEIKRAEVQRWMDLNLPKGARLKECRDCNP